ncbi:hypothetical protein QR680_004923 [Steinernema hermaphroditum]|uniref:MADF domain-containing protein n=1 Tax=Steinernema hermaphroditum TaxID=289476 RepID=A0AA39HQ98_9BILA|nr:hypothetical protein QR680_004923 [Steinernema hermaphroditum]
MTEGVQVGSASFDKKVAMVDLKDVSYDEKVRLIGFVQMNRCVWDPSHEKYFCATTKKIAWANIASEMSTPTSHYNEKVVYNIWRNLSDTLKKKITRLRSKMGDVETLDWDTALSDWKYYEHMAFIVEVLDSAIYNQIQTNTSKMSFESSIIGEDTTCRSILEEAVTWPPQGPSMKRDTVAEMYRNLEQYNMRVQAAKFRKEISDIVYKYELEIAETLNQR